MQFPQMAELEVEFPSDSLKNVGSELISTLNNGFTFKNIKPGDKVGITAGSRGISSIVDVLQAIIKVIKHVGGEPYILTAMGSHGGGTKNGQEQILDDLGINSSTLGVPIITEVESTQIGFLDNGLPVYCLNHALNMDHIIVVNRIRPHTSFRGSIESGLSKMLTIGLGGPVGARNVHRNSNNDMSKLIKETAAFLLKHLPVICGIALLENAYGKLNSFHILDRWEIQEQEPELLKKAWQLLPRIPFNSIDVLVVEEIGKCYSGTGMDTNIIGRMRVGRNESNITPNIKRIVVLGLAEASRGNANGIGLADFTTRKLVENIDFHATYLNCYTTGFLQRAMIPMVMPSDREAIKAAIQSISEKNLKDVKLIRIKNTKDLSRIWVSRAYETQLDDKPVKVINGWEQMKFTNKGELI